MTKCSLPELIVPTAFITNSSRLAHSFPNFSYGEPKGEFEKVSASLGLRTSTTDGVFLLQNMS